MLLSNALWARGTRCTCTFNRQTISIQEDMLQPERWSRAFYRYVDMPIARASKSMPQALLMALMTQRSECMDGRCCAMLTALLAPKTMRTQ